MRPSVGCRCEGVIGRDTVGVSLVDINPQQLAEKCGAVLPVAARITPAATIAGADPEFAVWPEHQVATIVVFERLGEGQDEFGRVGIGRTAVARRGIALDDGVAHAHVESPHFVFVVQGGIRDRDAADEHRRQLGHRREFSGASDLHIDAEHLGHLFLGRIFVRHCPARFAGDEAELALQIEPIDLVDHAIDVEREAVARLRDRSVVIDQALRALHHAAVGVHRNAHGGERIEHAAVRGWHVGPALHFAQPIGEERQGPLRGHRGIELALFLTLPATAAFICIAEPIVRGLFERGQFQPDDTLRTASALAALAVGLPAFVVVKALTPGFFAREDTRTPLYAAIAAISFNIALNALFLFFSSLHQVGIALASSLAGWLNAMVLGGILMHRSHLEPDSRLLSRAARMVVATIGMGAVLWLALILARPMMAHSDLGGFLGLAAVCVVGVLAYGLLGAALRIVNISELRFVMRRQPGVTPVDPAEPQ